jgi:Transposase DDE domain
MGNSISNHLVVHQCLNLLDIKNFRHPFADTGTKKLLTGRTILLMVEAQLRKHDSLWDISENLKSKKGLQRITGIDTVHGSSIHRKLETLPTELLQEMCSQIFQKVHQHHKHKEGIPNIGKLHIVDASKITLPDVAGKWAYCSKNENSVKIHLRYVWVNDKTSYPDKMVLSTGAVSDMDGALELVIDPDATYVMDRGYINYHLYHKWKMDSIQFVTRVKANSKLKILKERPTSNEENIIRDADVEIIDPKLKQAYTLRLVEYRDDQGKSYRVVTNRWDVSAFEVSEIYRYRWKIELFFKWIKQHLNVVKLYNHSTQAVWNQIYIAMIAYGLCELIKIQTESKRTAWEILKLLRHYWFDTWECFLKVLFRKPTRTSKGRKKKGKPGRPRKHPKKYKAVQIIVK